MAHGRQRESDTPLGAWLARLLKAKGFKNKTALVKALGVTWPTFNNWGNPDTAAEPEQASIEKIRQVLKLNRDERDELDEVIRRQSEVRAAALPRTATEPRAPLPADYFPSRAQVIAMLPEGEDPRVIKALQLHGYDSQTDPGRPFWYAELKLIREEIARLDRGELPIEDMPPALAEPPKVDEELAKVKVRRGKR